MLIAFCENCCDTLQIIIGRCGHDKARRDCTQIKKYGCLNCCDFERTLDAAKEKAVEELVRKCISGALEDMEIIHEEGSISIEKGDDNENRQSEN